MKKNKNKKSNKKFQKKIHILKIYLIQNYYHIHKNIESNKYNKPIQTNHINKKDKS